MKRSRERFHKLLSDAVTLFCKEEVSYSSNLHVTGTISINVDQDVMYKAIIDRKYGYSSDGRSIMFEKKLVDGGIHVFEGGQRTPSKQISETRPPHPIVTPPSNHAVQRPSFTPSRMKERGAVFSPQCKAPSFRPQNSSPRFNANERGMPPRYESLSLRPRNSSPRSTGFERRIVLSPRSNVSSFKPQNFSPRFTGNINRNIPCPQNVSLIRTVRQPIQNSPRHPVSTQGQLENIVNNYTEHNISLCPNSAQDDVVHIDSEPEVCTENEIIDFEKDSSSNISVPRVSVDSGYAASTSVETDMPLQPSNASDTYLDDSHSQQTGQDHAEKSSDIYVTLSSDEASDTSVESDGGDITSNDIQHNTPTPATGASEILNAGLNVYNNFHEGVKSEAPCYQNSCSFDVMEEVKCENVLTALVENIKEEQSAWYVSGDNCDSTIATTTDDTIGTACDSTIASNDDVALSNLSDNVMDIAYGGSSGCTTDITLSDLLSHEPATSNEEFPGGSCDYSDTRPLSDPSETDECAGLRRRTLPFIGARQFFGDAESIENNMEDSDERLSDPEYLPTEESMSTDLDDEKDADYTVAKANTKKVRLNDGTPRKAGDVFGEFLCKYDGCGRTFGFKGNLTRHQRSVHGRRFGDTFSATFECHLSNCRKKFATLNALKRHMKSRHGCDAGPLEQSL